jgi:hypothetical protein
VDRFHRWAKDDALREMTDGMVPVAYLPDDVDPAHQRGYRSPDRAGMASFDGRHPELADRGVTEESRAPR